MLSTELNATRLEILKEIVPPGRRFALPSGLGISLPAQLQAIADVAHVLGVDLQTLDIWDPSDLAPAFGSFRAGGGEAIDILSSPIPFRG